MTGSAEKEALVAIGRYFVEFGRLEAAIDYSVVSAFDLNDHPAAHAISEIDLRKKLAMLNAATQTAMATADGQPLQDDWREAAKTIIKRVQKLADTRNSFAHGRITVQPSGVVALSRGKQQWTSADFKTEFAKIDQACRSLAGIAVALRGVARTLDAVVRLVASASLSASADVLKPADFKMTVGPDEKRDVRAEPAHFRIQGGSTS